MRWIHLPLGLVAVALAAVIVSRGAYAASDDASRQAAAAETRRQQGGAANLRTHSGGKHPGRSTCQQYPRIEDSAGAGTRSSHHPAMVRLPGGIARATGSRGPPVAEYSGDAPCGRPSITSYLAHASGWCGTLTSLALRASIAISQNDSNMTAGSITSLTLRVGVVRPGATCT